MYHITEASELGEPCARKKKIKTSSCLNAGHCKGQYACQV
jgi:hypothetical protein